MCFLFHFANVLALFVRQAPNLFMSPGGNHDSRDDSH